ncbi:MAG TPA: EF-P lysine aminoacylase GenX [Planctomycetaceae bacterium]|nr:EF-P lysine aminoacylase GenX [Planctomycetaceae bacterium]
MGQAMDFLAQLCQHLLATPAVQRLSYREAFQQHLDLDPFDVSDRLLLKRIAGLDINPPDDWRNMDRDSWLNLLLADFVEPHLGIDGPTILFDYPASQAALAQIRPGPPAIAERFELYVNGIELANGYHELLDPEELRRRSQKVNEERQRDGNRPLPVKSQLLEAMEAGLPDCCGVALGFDRLVMLAAGVQDIQEVLPFPFDRA